MPESVARPDKSPVLETVTAREVVGFLKTRDQFEAAVLALQESGFERADIELMAGEHTVREKLFDIYTPSPKVDVDRVRPREAFLTRDDEVTGTAAIVGTLSSLGALGGVASVVASGGALALALATGLAAGTITGGIGAAIVSWITAAFEEELRRGLEEGALALWVRVQNPEEEKRAKQVLESNGAYGVQAHDIEIEKCLDDIPLADIRPDPWLGPKRLGEV